MYVLNDVVLGLAENPVRRQEIIDQPANVVGATEELLRAFSVTFSGRVLTQDHELRGVQMKKGDKITSVLPAANYDPTVFDNPREINFKRPSKPIVRTSVVSGKSVSVRVDLGCRRIIKQKKK